MPTSTFELSQPDLVDTIKDTEVMGMWECLRRARGSRSAAELAHLARRDLNVVHRALERLERVGLVRRLNARGRRRAVGYETTVDELSIVINSHDPHHVQQVHEIAEYINRELSDEIFSQRLPLGRGGPDAWHFHHCSPLSVRGEDLAELKRRIARVEEFVRLLGDRHLGETGTEIPPCNHGMVIRVEPIRTGVLPQPHVEFISRNSLDDRAKTRGLKPAQLTQREQQVARGLRDGKSRGEVAAHLGISALTVGTLCKRIYQKLGIRRVAELHHFTLD
jgi:DNA-binding CsgD family transcriptional regulator/DNA-binding MarR family transcriptional regulator